MTKNLHYPQIFRYKDGTMSDISLGLLAALKIKMPLLIEEKGLFYILDLLNRSISNKELFKSSQEDRSRVRFEKLKPRDDDKFLGVDCTCQFTRSNKKFNIKGFVFLKSENASKIINKIEGLIKKLLDKKVPEILPIILIIHSILNTAHPYQDGNGRTCVAFTKTIFEILQNTQRLDLNILHTANSQYNDEMYWCTINSLPDSLLTDLWEEDKTIDYDALCSNSEFRSRYNNDFTKQLLSILDCLDNIIEGNSTLADFELQFSSYYNAILELKKVFNISIVDQLR